MPRRRLVLGVGCCLTLGVIDLLALNLWVGPVVWPDVSPQSRPPPGTVTDDGGRTADAAPAADQKAPDLAPDVLAPRPDAAPPPDASAPVAPPAPPTTPVGPLVIFFDTASAGLRPGEAARLQALAGALQRSRRWSLEIEGHSDRRGLEGFNDTLSLQRAHAVLEHLASLGIERRRMTARGLGATRPADQRDAPEAWQRNRRVEIKIRKGAGKP
jgi:outer membrane protein OmpA-like peptidoglycan-associated protein